MVARSIVVNGEIYFSTMIDTVHVIDANAEVFDDKALLAVNDLGVAGKTWTLTGLAYAEVCACLSDVLKSPRKKPSLSSYSSPTSSSM